MPVNMDTADIRGMLTFLLSSVAAPLACLHRNESGWSRHDCNNAETANASNLVVTKLTLDARGEFGAYGRCNVCGPDGIDQMSGLPCRPGAYVCTCPEPSHSWPPPMRPCANDTSVGRISVADYFRRWPPCTWERWARAPYACWGDPPTLLNVTGGWWYSTAAAAQCHDERAVVTADRVSSSSTNAAAECSWRARVVKSVGKECSDRVMFGAVEAYDAASGRRCFEGCGDATRRNTTSVCWLYCFYATVLGPTALLPGGRVEPSAAMPLAQLEAAFTTPFKPVAEGGCPESAAG